MRRRIFSALIIAVIFAFGSQAGAQELVLKDLIAEALKGNYDLLASRSKIDAAQYRIPQAQSLPDPMIMAGYQNEGLSRYTYGEMQGSQWMFTASQMFPLWGKRALKGEMAERDAQSLVEMHKALQLKIISQVSALYFDLFLAYKNIDLIRGQQGLFAKIEDLAAARYAAGRSMQQEVLMAQTEKYMLLEKEEMQKQKILSLEAMLRSVLGRGSSAPPGKPAEPEPTVFSAALDGLLERAIAQSPEIRSRQRMVEGAEAKVKMANQEFYPDVTVSAGVFPRRGEFENMYNLTATFNLPLFYKTKQKPALQEANAALMQARHDLNGATVMVAAAVRDNYAMIQSTGRLMELYKNGLIPKAHQDFDLSISGYGTGGTDAIVAITRLKNALDYESQYWGQFVEREKAIARIKAIIGEE